VEEEEIHLKEEATVVSPVEAPLGQLTSQPETCLY